MRDIVENDRLTKEEIEIFEKILGLINRDYLRDYISAQNLCFSIGSMGDKFYEICDNLMKRADENLKKEEKEKYGREWVKSLFDTNKQNFYNDPLNGNHMTFDYALAIAKQSDVKNYNIYIKELEKISNNNLQLEEEFNIDEDIRNTIYPTNLEEKEDEIKVNEYEAEFVEPYPYNDYDILVMRSRMGSGKTTAMKKCLDDYQPKSVLFFSCRIIYSYNMMGEFKEYDIENYKDLKTDLNDVDKLFCSLESIHRINDENCYDLIILDELETLLNTFSGGTVASKEFEIKETFFEILKNGNKIIANDAFLSDRGVNFLQSLRIARGDENRIYLSINTYKPPPRNALVIKDKEKFENALLKDLEEGLRIVFHCSSKENVKRICNSIKNKYASNKVLEKRKEAYDRMKEYKKNKILEKRKIKLEERKRKKKEKKEKKKKWLKKLSKYSNCTDEEESEEETKEEEINYEVNDEELEISDDEVEIKSESEMSSDDGDSDDGDRDEDVKRESWKKKKKKKTEEKAKKYKVLVYHGDMDDKLKMKTATNVNYFWKKYDLIGYSPSINTGLNFTDDKYFDKKYFMGSKNSACCRDAIQAIDRCRETTTKELVVHFLNDYTDKSKFYESRDEAINKRFEYESKELKRLRKLYKIGKRKRDYKATVRLEKCFYII
jgi:hypothetical protein